MVQSKILKISSFRWPAGKQSLFLMAVAVAAPLLLIKVTPVVIAEINGTAHDFSNSRWSGGKGGKGCQVCHTPPASDTLLQPLWNHETTAASYTLYGSSSMDSIPGRPEGVSKLCLSCHDGTVALDSYGGATGVTTLTGRALIGTDLSASHPISMQYDTKLASIDSSLWDPSSTDSGLGGTIEAVLLYDNKVECASCHDVHAGTGSPGLLVKSNNRSALCFTCHKM